jgi:hypothetical protein
MVDLRTYVFLDSLQPQMASYISSISRGFLPVTDQACCVIEIAPGIEINRLTDVALKATNVMPGLQVVERAFGILEIHSDDQGDVRRAGEDILKAIDQTEENRIKPRILTSQLVKNLTDHHCQMINRTRYGQMLIRGDTLYILEVESAGYAYYAANEAEKASHIKIVDVKGIGKFGRVYIAGDESDAVEAKLCIEDKLAGISGREI